MLQLNCHKEGHISRQCPSHGREVVEIASNGKIKVQLKLLELTRGKTKKQFSVANNRPCEAGMYLTARVEDAEIKLVVDAGATVTLLSKRVFNQIKESREDITAEESNQEIMTSEGKPIKVYGVANLDITLRLSKYQRKMVVPDI